VALTLRNQTINTKCVTAGGFALPTILIASIVTADGTAGFGYQHYGTTGSY